MGLFSSKKVITVYANTVSLVELDLIPKTIPLAVMGAIIESQDIPFRVIDDLLNGSIKRANDYFRYGKGDYHYGMPGGMLDVTGINNAAIQTYLDTLAGTPTIIKDVSVAHEIGDHLLAEWLIDTFQYDPSTGLINSAVPETYPTRDLLIVAADAAFVVHETAYIAAQADALDQPDRTISYTSIRTDTFSDTLALVDTNGTSSIVESSFFLSSLTRNVTYDLVVQIAVDRLYETEYTVTLTDKITTVVETITTVEDPPGTFTDVSTFENVITYEETEVILNDSFQYEDSANQNFSQSFSYDVAFSAVFSNPDDSNSLFAILNEQYTTIESDDTEFGITYEVNGVLKFARVNYELNKATFINNAKVAIGGGYYPVIPIRRENVDLTRTEVRGGQPFITSDKLLDKLVTDLVQVADAINENPGIGDIDHAYFVLGVPITSTDFVVARYFFEFFDLILTVRSTVTVGGTQSGYSGLYNNDYIGNFVSIGSEGLNLQIGFGTITKTTETGVVTKRGRATVTHSASTTTTVEPDPFTATEGATRSVTRAVGLMTIRKQITDTTYEEIQVTDLQYVNQIYQNHKVTVTYDDALNGGDENFIIPLFEPAAKRVPIVQRDRLYYMAPHLVLNSYDITKVKWYATSFFSSLLKIAAIAFAVVTANPTGFTIAAGLGAVAWAIIKKFVIGLVIQFGFKLVAKALGDEFALLLGLVLAAYGLSRGNSATFFDIPDAQLLMSASNGLTQGVTEKYQDAFKDLDKIMEEFNAMDDARLAELAEVQDELESTSLLDPMSFVRLEPFVIFGETSDDYYSRTVHEGNPGSKVIDAVTYYYDIALKLPEIRDTVGGVDPQTT